MTEQCLKEQIYEPIEEAWKLLRPLQHMGGFSHDEEWKEWVQKCDSYCESIENEEIRSAVGRFLADMGTAIAHLNEGRR
jgi:hypothetical protein